jgi:hypothetical protein
MTKTERRLVTGVWFLAVVDCLLSLIRQLYPLHSLGSAFLCIYLGLLVQGDEK